MQYVLEEKKFHFFERETSFLAMTMEQGGRLGSRVK